MLVNLNKSVNRYNIKLHMPLSARGKMTDFGQCVVLFLRVRREKSRRSIKKPQSWLLIGRHWREKRHRGGKLALDAGNSEIERNGHSQIFSMIYYHISNTSDSVSPYWLNIIQYFYVTARLCNILYYSNKKYSKNNTNWICFCVF